MGDKMLIDLELLGNRIRQSRKCKNLTQEHLAERVGVSPFYISKIENAKANVSLELLLKIAFELDQNASYFLDGITYKVPIQHEIAQLLEKASPQKMRMITDIIKIICKS